MNAELWAELRMELQRPEDEQEVAWKHMLALMEEQPQEEQAILRPYIAEHSGHWKSEKKEIPLGWIYQSLHEPQFQEEWKQQLSLCKSINWSGSSHGHDGKSLVEFLEAPVCPSLQALMMFNIQFSKEHFQRLLQAPSLQELELFRHYPYRGDPETAKLIPLFANFPKLKTLDLDSIPITVDFIEDFLKLPFVETLESLTLQSNEFHNDDDLLELLQSNKLKSLKHFELSFSYLSYEYNGWVQALSKAPFLPQLEFLALEGMGIDDVLLQQLLSMPEEGLQLKELELGFNDISDAGFLALSEWPGLQGLKSLDLCGNRPYGNGFNALAESPWLQSLKKLDLGLGSGYDEFKHSAVHGLEKLLSSANLLELEELDLWSMPVAPKSFVALSQPGHFKKLKELRLNKNESSDKGFELICKSPLPSLNILTYNENKLSLKGLQHLEQAAFLPQLKSLQLNNNHLKKEALEILVKLPMDSVSILGLSGMKLSKETIPLLAELSCRNRVRTLYLNNAGLSAKLLPQFLEVMEEFPSLRHLTLDENKLGDKGFKILANSPLIGRLSLHVGGCGLQSEGIQAMQDSKHWTVRSNCYLGTLTRLSTGRRKELEAHPALSFYYSTV